MNKFIFRLWKHFSFRNTGKVGQYIVIYSFVFFPCLANAAPFPERNVIVIGVEKNPQFFKACVPCFEYIGLGAIKPDIIAQNKESIREGSFGRSSTAIQIKNKSDSDPDQRTNETGVKLGYIDYIHHKFSTILIIILFIVILLLLKKVQRLKWLNQGMESIVLHPPPHFNVRWDSKKAKWISLS